MGCDPVVAGVTRFVTGLVPSTDLSARGYRPGPVGV